jgi:hypothetical protein
VFSHTGFATFSEFLLGTALSDPGSSASIMTKLRVGRAGFDFRQRQWYFFFATASRLALGPTHSPIQWVSGAISPGREADHIPPCTAEVKNVCGAIPPIPKYVLMVWYLVKHRDNCTLTSLPWHCWRQRFKSFRSGFEVHVHLSQCKVNCNRVNKIFGNVTTFNYLGY